MEAHPKTTDNTSDSARALIARAPNATDMGEDNPAPDALHNRCKRNCAECPLAHLCRPPKSDQAQS